MQAAFLTLIGWHKVYVPTGGADHAAERTRWRQRRSMRVGTQVWGRASVLTEMGISHDL